MQSETNPYYQSIAFESTFAPNPVVMNWGFLESWKSTASTRRMI